MKNKSCVAVVCDNHGNILIAAEFFLTDCRSGCINNMGYILYKQFAVKPEYGCGFCSRFLTFKRAQVMSVKFDVFLQEQLQDPEFRKEYEALQPEHSIIQAMIDARKRYGLTQKELSERTGIAQGDICKLERGNANPSIRTLLRLTAGMGMRLRVESVQDMSNAVIKPQLPAEAGQLSLSRQSSKPAIRNRDTRPELCMKLLTTRVYKNRHLVRSYTEG